MIKITDVEKAFGKIKHPFMTQILNKLRPEWNFLHWHWACTKPTANIILDSEDGAFALSLGSRWIAFTTHTQHVLDIPATATREIKTMHTDQEGRMQLSLSADNRKIQRNLHKHQNS